jgi:hypothetical protein
MYPVPQSLIDKDRFLNGASEGVQGTSLSLDAAKEEVLRRFPGKSYCLVTHWIVADVLMTDQARTVVEVGGRKTRMVYAHTVIEDQAGRFEPGWWARSSWEVCYDQDGFFETRSTVYVLMGEGQRKETSIEVINGIF